MAAIAEHFTGHAYDGDEIKDARYGQGYTGPMDPADFVVYMARQGVALTATSGTPAQLLAATRAAIAAGHPVILQIPSAWNAEPPPTTGSTHAVVAVTDTGSGLVCMNPWGGFWHSGSYAYWQARIRYGVIWIAAKGGQTSMNIPQGWKDDGHTLTAPNGHVVTEGFRAEILDDPNWRADDQPLNNAFGAHVGQADGTMQDFKFEALMWNPVQNVWRHPYGADVIALRAQVADLQAQLAAAGQGTQAPAGAQQAIAAIQALEAAFSAVKAA